MSPKLIIFPGNFLPHIGGLETHVYEFAKYLSKDNDWEITIFVPNTENASEKEVLFGSIKVIRYPAFFLVANFPFPKFWLFKFWVLFFQLYKEDYDIVMTRTRFFINSTLGLFFAKFRFKRKVLIHVEHGSSFVQLQSGFKTKMARLYDFILGKLIFKLADKSIAISQVSYNFIKKEFIKSDRVDVPIIARGVDFALYKKISSDLNLRKEYPDKVLIGSLCRLYKWKGVANSIKAFKDLNPKIKDRCVYFIVGDGEDLNYLKRLAGNEKNIIFLGLVDFNKAISLLKCFDIFVHSSYPGGALSNSLLQAMYCKCAIVASPNEGANEVIFNNETGLLLRSNSVKNIKIGLLKLIESKDLREDLRLRANKYIKENFDWIKVVERYEKVFEEVLEKGKD